jgi:cytochrome c oxidase accessory protein FixG
MNHAAQSEDGALYQSHTKIHAHEVRGRYQRLRVLSGTILLGLFYGIPWLNWPLLGSESRPAVLFDLPARKFYVFDLIFLPQDFYLLTWLLIIAALSLFFFTALAGRLWCGFACPQTVWTELFVWMERITEGSRSQRIKLDRAPWTTNKVLRKGGKHLLWGIVALWTGLTFVGYFSPIRQLIVSSQAASLGSWELFWIIFYGFATYGNAGHMREQVCKYMCPYARFQSAMFDKHTLIISYDTARGEPRGARARNSDYRAQGLGDCVDCKLCVQVCPTGIDIRKGLQYECIECAACVDACDGVMDKMNYPHGLIKFSTQAAIDGSAVRVMRPRTLIYGALLSALVIGFGYAVTHRSLVAIDVLRDRNALYRTLDDGRIENVYTVRIINKDARSHRYHFSVSDLPSATVDTDQPVYEVPGSQVLSIAFRLRVDEQAIRGGHDASVKIVADDDPSVAAQAKARFFAPR